MKISISPIPWCWGDNVFWDYITTGWPPWWWSWLLIADCPSSHKSKFRVPGNPPANCGHLYCTYSTKTVTVNWNMLTTAGNTLQICKAASITKYFFKWHMFCVFDNSANPMMMLPGDSRYNLALSLLKLDYCSQSYTASGPQVPMCPP